MTALDSVRRKIKGKLFKVPGLITCREVESFVLAYLEGELSAPRRKAFEWHLRLCRECRDYLAAYKASIELAKRAVGRDVSKPDLPVPEDLITAIIEARKL
jgi:anti-sigma factor RsiW